MNEQPEDVQASETAEPDVSQVAEPTEPDVRQATVRRAPKWSVFIVVGMLVGLIATIAVTTAFPADPNIGMTMTVFVVGIFGVSGGALLGAIVALIADRVSSRRVREVTVERGVVVTEAADPDLSTGAGTDADAEAQPDAETQADTAEPQRETEAQPETGETREPAGNG